MAARDPRVSASLDRIHLRYAEPLTVQDLARDVGMSRFRFTRLFREQVGEAPYRYLIRVRIAKAAELLRSGRHGVSEAAFTVGFRDLGRFRYMFRREVGWLPGKVGRG
jgi:AraC family transcriptional regulator